MADIKSVSNFMASIGIDFKISIELVGYGNIKVTIFLSKWLPVIQRKHILIDIGK